MKQRKRSFSGGQRQKKHQMETMLKIVGDYYEMELDNAREELEEVKNFKGKVTQTEAQVNYKYKRLLACLVISLWASK